VEDAPGLSVSEGCQALDRAGREGSLDDSALEFAELRVLAGDTNDGAVPECCRPATGSGLLPGREESLFGLGFGQLSNPALHGRRVHLVAGTAALVIKDCPGDCSFGAPAASTASRRAMAMIA